MYFITTKRMLEVCFSAHPNIQYRTYFYGGIWGESWEGVDAVGNIGYNKEEADFL